jgi:hypothetical protein
MARSSPYGGYLNRLDGIPVSIPRWVTGSDYGMLDAQLSEADKAGWNAESARQNAYQNQLQTDDLRRERDFQDTLGEQFRLRNPATLRDAYQISLDQGLIKEDPGSVLDAMRRLEARKPEDDKFREIQTAYRLGQIDPKLARDYLQEKQVSYDFPADAWNKPGRGRGATKGTGSMKPYISPDGEVTFIPSNDYEGRKGLLEQGFTPGETKREREIDPMQQRIQELLGSSGSGLPGEGPTERQKKVADKVKDQFSGLPPAGDGYEYRMLRGKPVRVKK